MYTIKHNSPLTSLVHGSNGSSSLEVVSFSYRELNSDSYSKFVPNYTQSKLKIYLKELPLDVPMILISRYIIVNILIGQCKGVNMCEDI